MINRVSLCKLSVNECVHCKYVKRVPLFWKVYARLSFFVQTVNKGIEV